MSAARYIRCGVCGWQGDVTPYATEDERVRYCPGCGSQRDDAFPDVYTGRTAAGRDDDQRDENASPEE